MSKTKKSIYLSESQFNTLLGKILVSESNEGLNTITANSPLELYKKVKTETRGKKVDLNSIEIYLSDDPKTQSFFKYNENPSGKNVQVIVIPFSEESDEGECPSCDKVRSSNPLHKVVKVGKNKNKDYGTFGKNRKFQVIAVFERTKKDPTEFQKVSDKSLSLLRGKEKFIDHPYDDGFGNLTIGYGTLVRNYPELQNVKKISEPKATEYIRRHIEKEVIPVIHKFIDVPISQNQFDALSILIYNIGRGNFLSSDLPKYINSNDKKNIKNTWLSFTSAGNKKAGGLPSRRQEELNLFNTESQ